MRLLITRGAASVTFPVRVSYPLLNTGPTMRGNNVSAAPQADLPRFGDM